MDASWLVVPKPPSRENGNTRSTAHSTRSRGRGLRLWRASRSLREEVITTLGEVGLSKLTEIQCVDVTSGMLGSHIGSRKMIFYLLPVCCSGVSFFSIWSICTALLLTEVHLLPLEGKTVHLLH